MKNDTPPHSKEQSSVLVSSVKRILRPLVGFLMDSGLTHKWLVSVLKEVYVEVAKDEFTIPGKQLTNSRISLITGVHRKDVSNLINGGGMDDTLPSATMFSSRLLAKWLGDQRYCDIDGNPLSLTRLANSESPSFEELVSSTSTDIRPKPVLDEWLNLGIVKLDKEDRVQLQQEAFLPTKDHDQKLYFLGKNVSDHLSAARANTQTDAPPYLERSVYYDQLSEESLQHLEALSRTEAMKMLRKLNSAANKLQKEDQSLHKSKRSGRMNLGVYYYDEKNSNEADKS